MDPDGAHPYRDAKRAGRDAVAERLLDLADARLADEGPDALSMRRLANAAGCSTMVFYTAFTNKAGLLDALAEREVDRWADAALTLADPDPVAWLDATGSALHAMARARPHHRALVFASPALERLGAAVRAAVARAWPAGADDGDAIAAAVWSAWRGAWSIEALHDVERVHAGVVRLWGAAVAVAAREAARGGDAPASPDARAAAPDGVVP